MSISSDRFSNMFIDHEFEARICPVCKKKFEVFPASRMICCSAACDRTLVVRKKTEEFMAEAGVPSILREAKITKFRNSADTARIIEYARSPEGSLVLYGDAGRGKSFLAAGVCRVSIWQGGRALWRNSAGIASDLRSSFAEGSPESRIFAPLFMASLLIVDDLGAEQSTPTFVANIYLVAEKRSNDRKPTIYTTNLNSQGIADRYGDKFASRILSGMNIQVSGNDYRFTEKKIITN